MLLVRVKRPGETVAHLALESEIRPLCVCSCASPVARKKAGDTLCRCRCHVLGPRFSLSLCEMLARKHGTESRKQQQLTLTGAVVMRPKRAWKVVETASRECHTCRSLGIRATRGELQWALEGAAGRGRNAG